MPEAFWLGNFEGKDLQEKHFEIWRRKCDSRSSFIDTKSVHEEIGQESEKIIFLKPHKQPSSQIGQNKDFFFF